MNRLRKAREQMGIRQADLAKELEISQATLSNWERGVHDLDNESLKKMANYFGVSTDYLLGYAPETDDAGEKIDQVYYRIAQDAKNSGISPADFEMALNFLKKAKERDENVST
ncbi:MAG: helix-turn-helix domain-containing protein [Defluviitaleaceae bacterium]|nr:helix-turn-helix domain-containing protein [Defluviitaleaceae bacterium]